MPEVDIMVMAEQAINEMLVWVGFGTLVGLSAKAIMPGRDPGGTVATLLMGIGGSVIGCGTLMFLTNVKKVTPISPLGFVAATGGAFAILFFYRLLSGSFFTESEDGDRFLYRRNRRRRQRRITRDAA
ncbi:Transglycosylase associated protein [hydrothermal vent metagenome]|uniref:Transglycosylase associated protein n=1 Tax=hydrothermal vent metagenome TaxID=652676 RepID=A0A3B1E2U8_9ZZZZ